MKLTAAQQAVVEHGSGACRVSGGFGTGKSTALAARAEHLRAQGGRPLLVHHRDFVGFAMAVLRRHGGPARLMGAAEQEALVRSLVAEAGAAAWPSLGGEVLGDPAFVPEVAATLLAYQSSFLGEEELGVHAAAAGDPDRWGDLAVFAARYLAALAARGRVDAAGALVAASMALRDPAVAEAERGRFTHLLVDDYQLADFAVSRLVAQLAGPGGDITVAGNPEAAVGDDALATERHFLAFARRFGPASVRVGAPCDEKGDGAGAPTEAREAAVPGAPAAVLDVGLDVAFRHPGVPTLRLVGGAADEQAAIGEARAHGTSTGLSPSAMTAVPRHHVARVVGAEWPLVVVPGASDGTWPQPYRPARWFDLELLGGPDVPDDATRQARFAQLEHRRFAVACSRATRWLVVIATPPVSPFIGDLVR